MAIESPRPPKPPIKPNAIRYTSIKNPTLGTLVHSSLTCPLHLSRTLYKSAPFYAKQTQFPKGQNERKIACHKGL